MFNHILVPLDGSRLAESVLPHVAAIARAQGALVMLLHVLDASYGPDRIAAVDPFDWQIRRAEAEAYLKDVAARLEKIGLNVQVSVVEGKAAESVIQYAHANEVNLIVLSSHGQSGISGWNISSVVQKVILRSRKSVMIVRAYKPVEDVSLDHHYQRFLVPLDGSQRAESVLPLATSLSRHYKADLLIVHVVQKPEMPRRTPPNQEDNELSNRVVERNREEASNYLAELQSRLDTSSETRLLVSDNVAKTLHEVVESESIDMVVLSAHGYSGEPRWPYGTTVVSFIVYGTSPLLVIQDLPEDLIQTSEAERAAQEQGGR